MTPDERWLAALWPSVRAPLPAPPARVLQIGCGPLEAGQIRANRIQYHGSRRESRA